MAKVFYEWIIHNHSDECIKKPCVENPFMVYFTALGKFTRYDIV